MEIILVSLFLSISLATESLGVWLRVIGSFNGEPSQGYSSHVRVATAGRFFILLTAPALGYLVDSGAQPHKIAMIGFMSYLFTSFIIISGLLANPRHYIAAYSFLNFRHKTRTNVKIPISGKTFQGRRFKYIAFLSFALTASGVVVVNFAGAYYPEHRAMIVQLSAAITMIGTVLHVFFIDPVLAYKCDSNADDLMGVITTFLISRLVASTVLSLIFLVLAFA